MPPDPSSPYADLAAFTALPRTTGLALCPDGSRLVAVLQQPDELGTRYVSALWDVPLDGGAPVRLTRSAKGESAPAFLPDGTLLFVSSRPDSAVTEEETAVWALPQAGEPYVRVHRSGGLNTPVVAVRSGAVLLTGSRLVGSTDADDAQRRTTRRERKINAVLHDGMPIRYWDRELGAESTRLLLLEPADTEPVDLAPDARFELTDADYSISADGRRIATTWHQRGPRGRKVSAVAVIDRDTGTRTVHPAGPAHEFVAPRISPDGARLAVVQARLADFTHPPFPELVLLDLAEGTTMSVELGDVWPTSWVWADAGLVVTGDWHGRGALLLVDPHTGAIRRWLSRDGVYTSLQVAGPQLVALRTTIDTPPAPVRLELDAAEPATVSLPDPAPAPPLPGTLTELEVPIGDGASVRAWLCRPHGDAPVPVMTWIHGGPFASYNAWSWRWAPWVAVAHGWAVLLPDPALSTGYGATPIEAAWPYLADVVWREVEAVLDAALTRPDLDGSRLALLGGSFGGFMTNWIAGHTDRFGAIVTHAGLWALDQQHATTDAADYKTGIFGRPADHPQWYVANSPNESLDKITTPMLVVHGNRDYRVPVSEALRLWWDLVNTWPGPPDELPHRFLQFTAENHWILSPANAEIWYHTVLGFCAQHVLGEPWHPSDLL